MKGTTFHRALAAHMANATPGDERGRLSWREALAAIVCVNAALWGAAWLVGWWLS